jgi:molecular chaperone GrpE (heat shock protein)
MQSSNKEASKASVIQNFLPVMDELLTIKSEIGETDFGQKYGGLSGAMSFALKELGVVEYTVAAGDAVNPQKVATIEEEYSDSIPKGSVIRPVSMGMELAGNVMRLAQAVVSLGPAQTETAEEDSDAPVEDETPSEE